jgi:hypothetical protein
LKSRFSIDPQHEDLWPPDLERRAKRDWFLLRHVVVVRSARRNTVALESTSFQVGTRLAAPGKALSSGQLFSNAAVHQDCVKNTKRYEVGAAELMELRRNWRVFGNMQVRKVEDLANDFL